MGLLGVSGLDEIMKENPHEKVVPLQEESLERLHTCPTPKLGQIWNLVHIDTKTWLIGLLSKMLR